MKGFVYNVFYLTKEYKLDFKGISKRDLLKKGFLKERNRKEKIKIFNNCLGV